MVLTIVIKSNLRRECVTCAAMLLLFVAIASHFFLPVAAQSEKVPVVIQFRERPTSADLQLVLSSGGEIIRVYNIINGFAAKLPHAAIDALRQNPRILSIDLDVVVNALDLAADQQIRADQVWAEGDTGYQIPVAILDTGIFKNHGEFVGRIALCHNEIFADPSTCDDLNGHGTHVAGIVGATGVVQEAKGVAPQVSFYIDQVLDSSGIGSLSGIISGIDWVVSMPIGTRARVISMSLGTNPLVTLYDKSKPNCDGAFPSLTTAVNNAVSAGVTVVAAAGNSGTSGLGAPACISSAIAVGAVDSTDKIASFSSQGGPMKDHGIVAPGVNIYSTWLNWGYQTLSGTSMATPHVSGTVALMLKANPSLTPTAIRNVLFSTACTSGTTPACSQINGSPNTVYGYGRVDALRAYTATSSPTPYLSLSANPTTITTAQTSTISASTSDSKTGVTVSFSSNIGSLNPASCTTDTTGKCSVTFSSSAQGTATIVAAALSYTSAQTTVIVTSPTNPSLSVSVATDKGSYKRGQMVTITVTVTSSGIPVSGATVSIAVYYPNGNLAPSVPSQTTDAYGKAIFRYIVTFSAPKGVYRVVATASLTGYTSGTGSTTFNVR